MDLCDAARRSEESGDGFDLRLEVLQVRGALRLILRNDRVAATVPAESFAKGQVEIKRQIPPGSAAMADFFENAFGAQFVGEVDSRRIRGVAWPGNIVLADLFNVDKHSSKSKTIWHASFQEISRHSVFVKPRSGTKCAFTRRRSRHLTLSWVSQFRSIRNELTIRLGRDARTPMSG